MYIFWPFTQLRDAVLTGSVIYRVTEEGLMDRLSTDIPESCVHGSADEAVPVEDAFEFSKIIANHKLHVIEGANHCYTSHHLS
ncbi:hypothetical protein TB2_017619 [Malus domestica]